VKTCICMFTKALRSCAQKGTVEGTEYTALSI
jgi:hypothetical protein